MDASVGQAVVGSEPIIPAPKFKRRAVSAVRDYPPGCGREPTSAWDRQIAVIPASESVDVESLLLRVIRCVIRTRFFTILCY